MNVYLHKSLRDRMKGYDLAWSQIASVAFEDAMNAHDRIAASPCIVICGTKSFGPFPNFAAAKKATESKLSPAYAWTIVPITELEDEGEQA